jgi:ABC-type multidrug transport system fused ATPase/permease subunit
VSANRSRGSVIARKIFELLTPRQRRQLASVLALTIVGMLLELVGLGLVIPVVAVLTQPDVGSAYPMLAPVLHALGDPAPAQLVIIGMVALVAVHLVRVSFLGFLAWRQMVFAFEQQAEMSERLFATYLRQPYVFHLNRNSAHLIQNATGEVRLFTFSVTVPAMFLLTEASVIAAMAALLFVLEPVGATAVAVAFGAAAWLFQRAVRTAIEQRASARLHHEAQRLLHLQQGLGGVKDAKLLGREDEFLAEYRHHNDQSARVGRFQHTLQQFPRLWLELLAVAGLAALVVAMTMKGRDVAAIVPTLGVFAAAAFRVMPSINRLLAAVQSLRFAVPVVETLHDELIVHAAPWTPQEPRRVPFTASVDLAEVTFTYPGAPAPALDGLSMTVRKGESVGFVGPSGSGKSTLVDLVLGLLTPDSGEVRVDGINIQTNLRGWQDQLGYVPQSIYLTDDTLRRNIAFGLPADRIDDAAVGRAVKAAQLDAFVASLPAGLNTIVGERGVRLSGGQRQRIGIARALYHDPEVLVLDEATSALDVDTEQGVMQAVAALHGVKTLLIVAHRLSTVAGCDRLYRLEGGRIVDVGASARIVAGASG